MIITPFIRSLVYQIESVKNSKPLLKLLFLELQKNCLYHNVYERNFYKLLSIKETPYPIEESYAIAFDPLFEEDKILQYWYQYGFVVAKNITNDNHCSNVISMMHTIMDLSEMNLSNPNTWKKDNNQNSLLSRGFFEIYHDDSIAQIRQNIRLYLYHVILWGSPFLWTSYDRLGIKLPEGEESHGLPLHVDQNPEIHPDFTTIQGVLALEDCPIERGTFVGVPGSYQYFKQYIQYKKAEYKGEYILLPPESKLYESFLPRQQKIPLRKGHIVSWDSRTTHANSSNISNKNRYVLYVSMGLAKNNNESLKNIRKNAFKSGIGENMREAYLHASKKPRFTDNLFLQKHRKIEDLTPLGKYIYGLEDYPK